MANDNNVPPANSVNPSPQFTVTPLTNDDFQKFVQFMMMASQSNQSTPRLSTEITDTHFRLIELDPDRGSYSVQEWCDDATRTKNELKISDHWMIVKAGDAMKGSALRFYNAWKPQTKSWVNFVEDLKAAFPDGCTWHQRLQRAVNCISTNYKTLREYGSIKMRLINAFHDKLPWDKVLSWIEGDIQDVTIREFIHNRCPKNETELLRDLVYFEPQREDKENRRVSESRPTRNLRQFRPYDDNRFSGKCFNCNKTGHRQSNCTKPKLEESSKITTNGANTATNCTHCGRSGHDEESCWKKHGRPTKILLVQNGKRPLLSAYATAVNNANVFSVRYLIDSGAEVSIIHSSIANKLNVTQRSSQLLLQGMGSATIRCNSICSVWLQLENITLEVEFTIVPNDTIPGNIDALIGWDVISRKGIQTHIGENGLELHHSPITATITSVNDESISVMKSGLDELMYTRLKEMLRKFKKLTPSCVTTGTLTITLKDQSPVVYRPRRLAYAERIQLKKMIQEMLNDGIIRESHSAYSSPIVLVKKKNGDLRLCIDFRELNKKVVKERYPLPLIQDQIDSLAKAKYFTVLDMKSGFHQIKINEESKHLTAFVTPDGHFEFERMPFGFVNAPSCYQRAIDRALGGLKGDCAFVYLDDVLIVSTTIEEGYENLGKVLHTLSTSGFSLNYEKCQFFQETIEYLGVLISAGNVRPSPQKVKALTESQAPTDVKGVRQFMGLAGYFRRFMKNFSITTAPITSLLRKNVIFMWTPECEKIRVEIIEKLVEQPILRIFNQELPIELHTDASSIGLGAALMQRENGIVQPVAYFSRKNSLSESKYHSYELETLAIVEATHHFRVYLYGVHFTVVTDCNSVRASALKKELEILLEIENDPKLFSREKMTNLTKIQRICSSAPWAGDILG